MKIGLTFRDDKGRFLNPDEVDANFDRLMYWSGSWSAGTYTKYEVVKHRGRSWICVVPSTTAEPNEASADWVMFKTDYTELFTGAALTDITGVTPVVFSYDAVNPNPSIFFDVVGGNLQAKLDFQLLLDITLVWTPLTANNEDAGIIADVALRSALNGSTIPIDDPYGNIFQSSRANTAAMGASHNLGATHMKAGDTLGIDVSDYTGQSGQTDMARMRLYVTPAE